MNWLTATRVEETYAACLYTDEELPDWDGTEESLPGYAIITDGVLNKTGFHPARIDQHHEEIQEMLRELPLPFRKEEGGGWSFLAACDNRHGEQWTGFHRTMDMLFQLGMAIGAVTYLLPREMWGALPGGMPYLVIDLEGVPA